MRYLHLRLINSLKIVQRHAKANPSSVMHTTPEMLGKKVGFILLGSTGRIKLGTSTFAELMYSKKVSQAEVGKLLLEKFGSKERVRIFLTRLIDRMVKEYDSSTVLAMAERISKKKGLPVESVKHYLDHHFGNSSMPLRDKLSNLRASFEE